MTYLIQTPVVLSHKNIVPGTEQIRIKGTQQTLIRGSDYEIDYLAGELRFSKTGAVIPLGQQIEEGGLDIEYSYQVSFSKNLLQSQIEVFDEVALYQNSSEILVSNSPINDVIRVYNLTTQELYQVTSADKNKIQISGDNLPKLKSFKKLSIIENDLIYNKQNNYFLLNKEIVYPNNYFPNRNPLISLDNVLSKARYARKIITGGTDILSSTVELLVPLELLEIQLFTGGRTLKQSRTQLTRNIDYSFELIPELQIIDHYKIKITLTGSGQQKIRTNNLYLKAIYNETPQQIERQQATYKVPSYPINEVIEFNSNVQSLTKIFSYTKIGEVSDETIFPHFLIFDPDLNKVYKEGIDYVINPNQKLITKIEGGEIQNKVCIAYLEIKDISVDLTLVNDVIIVDYIWGNNSLNWESEIKKVPIVEKVDLDIGQQFIILKKNPLIWSDVKIYLTNDPYKIQQVAPLSYNKEERRLHIEAIRVTAEHTIEYIANSQPIEEQQIYFVSYKYGAQRQALETRYAKMMNLVNTQTEREEVYSLLAGTSEVILMRSPSEIETILIYEENDPLETSLSTALRYDQITKKLYFTPLPTAGRKVFRYKTNGYHTPSLRNALEGLFETFKDGPTLESYKSIISHFTDQEPEITLLTSEGFKVTDSLMAEKFTTSSDLEDGTKTVTFEPARFNLGAYLTTAKGSYIKAPWTENISLLEGTAEFLVGIAFEPNDSRDHYFIDIKGQDPQRNRLSLYKSSLGYLNFDIWDNKGILYRTSLDVEQVYQTEIIQLVQGQASAILSYQATPAQIDLNNNQIPDIYEGLETKFIITPDTNTYPEDFLKQSIKVLQYDTTTNTIYFEPIEYAGQYVFSYITGLIKYEETENFICATWKLHTLDGEDPFYKLYVNGVEVESKKLKELIIEIDAQSSTGKSQYDISEYDIDIYESD